MHGYSFTRNVRDALARAREEAVSLRHEYVETEHLLLGLLHDGDHVARRVLLNLGCDLGGLRADTLTVVRRGFTVTGPDLSYTSRAKRVLELAMGECRAMQSSHVGTEHLLLGLLLEGKGIAAQMLHAHDVTIQNARDEVLRATDTHHAPRKPDGFRRDDPFPHFARRVREVIAASFDVATARSSAEVTTLHAAMALLMHQGGAAHAALDRIAFDKAVALARLDEIAERGEVPLSSDAVVRPAPELVDAITGMERLAESSHVSAAGSQHLLIALLHANPAIAGVFAAQGATLERVAEAIAWMTG